MSCGVGHRRGSGLVLLWLWCRLAAVAPIGPLAWEPPCAAGADLKRQKKKKKKKKECVIYSEENEGRWDNITPSQLAASDNSFEHV